jgi:prepilin-type N-terminal cleavage/methylation domain-containing protein
MQLRPSRIPRPERAFTLIELLVVISIIAILASLALPALNGAMTAANKGRANAMISQLKVAVTGYNTEYGTWPSTSSTPSSADTTFSDAATSTLYHILVGDSTGTTFGNTRNIVFMEFSTKDTDAAGTTAVPTTFVDPWYKSNPTQNYTVVVDGDYNNQIDVTAGGGPNNLNAGCAIFDAGPPLKKGQIQTDKTKFLHSW